MKTADRARVTGVSSYANDSKSIVFAARLALAKPHPVITAN